ncbi:MAG: hypothetical protein A2Y73_01650 [Chloroflexi bacterium RBG_13_56_8]|nr:MAG: hypothetical protein A2Y73_01650 [Chloroflexi bacterium RBG_13_56_8]
MGVKSYDCATEMEMRLGFPVRVYGCPNLPSHDARHWADSPHLSVSLAYLRDILHYLHANHIHMYRMHERLAPHILHPELPDLWKQIEECAIELAAIGELAKDFEVRLSFHPSSAVMLNALNEEQVSRSVTLLRALASLFEAMNLGPDAVIVLHVGGVYDRPTNSRDRFIQRYEKLPQAVRRHLALENDGRRFSFADIQAIHQACGIRLVFDTLHHQVLNMHDIPTHQALAYCLDTWPEDRVPKVHFSTPRSEIRPLEGTSHLKVPTWEEHSDFVNPFEFAAFMRSARELRKFDVMLEAKARDLALIKLRQDLDKFAPELAHELA